PGPEGLAAAVRSALVAVDEVEIGVGHDHPVTGLVMDAAVAAHVRLPGGAGGVAVHGPGTVAAGHRMIAVMGGVGVGGRMACGIGVSRMILRGNAARDDGDCPAPGRSWPG